MHGASHTESASPIRKPNPQAQSASPTRKPNPQAQSARPTRKPNPQAQPSSPIRKLILCAAGHKGSDRGGPRGLYRARPWQAAEGDDAQNRAVRLEQNDQPGVNTSGRRVDDDCVWLGHGLAERHAIVRIGVGWIRRSFAVRSWFIWVSVRYVCSRVIGNVASLSCSHGLLAVGSSSLGPEVGYRTAMRQDGRGSTAFPFSLLRWGVGWCTLEGGSVVT